MAGDAPGGRAPENPKSIHLSKNACASDLQSAEADFRSAKAEARNGASRKGEIVLEGYIA